MKLYEVASKEVAVLDKDQESIIKKFIQFVMSELGLDTAPKFRFFADTDFSIEHSSFGGYRDGVIYTMLVNRHLNDVFRSIAHEMVHYRQDLEGRIKIDSGETGSDIENEANYIAGIIMRKWGKKHPNIFALPPITS